jgi:hypothetical protein
MPETSPNLGLQAPLGTEPVNQGDDLMRANNVILDTEIKALQDGAGEGMQSGVVWFPPGVQFPGGDITVPVSFAVPFAAAPVVILGAIGNPGGSRYFVIRAGSITVNGFTARASNSSTENQEIAADWECSWLAVPRGLKGNGSTGP